MKDGGKPMGPTPTEKKKSEECAKQREEVAKRRQREENLKKFKEEHNGMTPREVELERIGRTHSFDDDDFCASRLLMGSLDPQVRAQTRINENIEAGLGSLFFDIDVSGRIVSGQ